MAGATKSSGKHAESAAASRAAAALSRGACFDAERLAHKALMSARHDQDFARMAAIVPTLMDARLKRLQMALDVKRITIVDASWLRSIDDVAIAPAGDSRQTTSDESADHDAGGDSSSHAPRSVSPGCYLVQPPQVAADARRLRVTAFEQNAPVAVLCREPLTMVKLLPVVAIAPGSTVRAKVRPPKQIDKPDMAWFVAALEAIGDAAIDSLDSTLTPLRRVEALLERLDAIPEHRGLHLALQQACLDAQAALDQAKAARAAKKAAGGVAGRKPEPNPIPLPEADELGDDVGDDAGDDEDDDMDV